MRITPLRVTCNKCGHSQETKSETGWYCRQCKAFTDLRVVRRRPHPEVLSRRGTLAGYCAACGLMRMKYERGGCPKCGSVELTQSAPEEACRLTPMNTVVR